MLGVDAEARAVALQVLRAAHELAGSEPVAQHEDVKFKASPVAVRQASRDYPAAGRDSSTLTARLAMSLSVEGATNADAILTTDRRREATSGLARPVSRPTAPLQARCVSRAARRVAAAGPDGAASGCRT